MMTLTYITSIFFGLRAIAKPVEELIKATQELSVGKMDRRISKAAPPVEKLAQAFNRMAETLDEQRSEQLSLLSAIPHELRTPLSRIQAALDLARRKTSFDELKVQLKK